MLAFSTPVVLLPHSAAPALHPARALSRAGGPVHATHRNASRCAATPRAPAVAEALLKTDDQSPCTQTDPTAVFAPVLSFIHDTRVACRRLLRVVWPLERGSILRAVVFSLFTSVCSLIAPLFLSRTVHSIVTGGQNLLQHVFCLSVIYLASTVCTYIAVRCTSAATSKIGATLRTTLFDRVLRAPMSSLHLTGGANSALSSLNSDADVVETALSEKFIAALTASFESAAAFACLVFFCPSLALLTAVLVPWALLLSARLAAHAAAVDRSHALAKAAASQSAAEHLSALSTVKALAAEQWAGTKHGWCVLDALSCGLGAARSGGVMEAWNHYLLSGATVAFLAVGGALVAGGQLSVASMLAFAAYGNLLGSSLGRANKALRALGRAGGPAKRVHLVMSLPSESPAPCAYALAAQFPAGGASVAFRNVSFSYPGSTRQALSEVSFTIPAGSSAAFVGRRGAGRSSVANLIARMRAAGSGKVLVGGADVSEMTPSLLRGELLGFVTEDARMLPGTIAENIALGRQGARPDEIRTAARNAGVLEFAFALKHGLDESAEGLSAGQRQRVNLARVLLRNASVLVADEPEAELDAISKKFVNNCLDRMIRDGNTTVVLNCHEITRAKACDQIFVVDEGRIVEEGTHEELLALGGLYKGLLMASIGVERERKPPPPRRPLESSRYW